LLSVQLNLGFLNFDLHFSLTHYFLLLVYYLGLVLLTHLLGQYLEAVVEFALAELLAFLMSVLVVTCRFIVVFIEVYKRELVKHK